MTSRSFKALLQDPATTRVQIPIIQRDYAQGRPDEAASEIRGAFLSALHKALVDGRPISLDFIFGEVSAGTFVPLDGQQRLTTLFLLHWYLAARIGLDPRETAFLRGFSYETRPSSRAFCARLIEQRPPFPLTTRLSHWIRDQSWFVTAWDRDPTIDSMLVVLDAIDSLFQDEDSSAAWSALTDDTMPAVSFHVLPIEKMGLTDDLYIKMNSRGKPLTPFEHFKASFEELLKETSADAYREFINKIDNAWADNFWPLRGPGMVFDEQFMRYLRYVTDLLTQWKSSEGVPPGRFDGVERSARLAYGPNSPNAPDNLRFLFDSLDCWNAEGRTVFDNILSADRHVQSKLTIFGPIDLFLDCAKSYSGVDGTGFGLQRFLLLYAFLLRLTKTTPDFHRRLRQLRNLVIASTDELRVASLPVLISDAYALIVNGALENVEYFNSRQIREEVLKVEFLAASPGVEGSLFRLEDHRLIQGCTAAFDRDVSTFERRVAAFLEIFPETGDVPKGLSAAFLACGDYSQQTPRSKRYQLATSKTGDPVWRQLLTSPAANGFQNTKRILSDLLDRFAQIEGTTEERLQAIAAAFLAKRDAAKEFDWRYYLVKYEAMREGKSGIYVGDNGAMGFRLCMLDRKQLNSSYRDPYLLALVRLSGARLSVDVQDPWYTGYETQVRWLTLSKSEVQLACRKEGFDLAVRTEAGLRIIQSLSGKYEISDNVLLRIPQAEIDGVTYDREDRIELGARFVQDILARATPS